MEQLQNATRRLALMVGGLSLSDLKREDGQTFVEYALVVGVISIAIAGGLLFFKNDVTSAFTTIGDKLGSDI